MKKLIIFICNGNIHRSVIAAECLKKILKKQETDQNILVDSYGLQGTKGTNLPKYKHLSEYSKEWKAAKPTLQKFNIDISNHSFQKITETAIKEVNVVIAMDDKVYSKAENSLINQFSIYKEKVHNFSELTVHNKGIKDLAGNSSKKMHAKIIEDIYFTLSENYKDILKWLK